MADKFDKLASELKATKTSVEAAQYLVEECRSLYIYLEKQTKKCEQHEATIKGLQATVTVLSSENQALTAGKQALLKKLDAIKGMAI